MHRGSLCPKRRRNRGASHCSVPSFPHAAHSHFSYFLLTFPVIWSAKPPRRGSALGGSWLLHSCHWRRAPHGIASHTRTNPHTALRRGGLRYTGIGLQRERLTLTPSAPSTGGAHGMRPCARSSGMRPLHCHAQGEKKEKKLSCTATKKEWTPECTSHHPF
jgi:hypothetical protein